MSASEINPAIRTAPVALDSLSWNGVHLLKDQIPLLDNNRLGDRYDFPGRWVVSENRNSDESAKTKQGKRAAVVPPVERRVLKARRIERDHVRDGERRVLAVRVN